MAHVVVAMSGGVDSSVAAALLKEQGHQVTGLMLRLWSEPGQEDSNHCCSPDAMSLARRVAARLGIPFYVVDAGEVFRRVVVQAFIDGYAAGRTPNPCLSCNRVIRWEFLLEQALEMGAEKMATGHYVRLLEDPPGTFQLLRAADYSKDQSYVLHVLDQQKLAHALFPIGEYPKEQVRALAEKFNLPTATRPDSQDLCFLAGADYRTFLQRHAPQSLLPGQILDPAGTMLGQHGGLANYTIGQRKGLGLASPVPLYVLGKQVAGNALIVGPYASLGRRTCQVTGVHWLSGSPPALPLRVEVKTRYTARAVWANLLQATLSSSEGEQVELEFEAPVRDLTPGQAAVFYQGALMLGGGEIAA